MKTVFDPTALASLVVAWYAVHCVYRYAVKKMELLHKPFLDRKERSEPGHVTFPVS